MNILMNKYQAKQIIANSNSVAVDYVREFIEKIDNLTVAESTGYDFVEVDPSEEINRVALKYILFAIDEGLIEDSDDFDKVYLALRILQGDENNEKGSSINN